MLPKFLDLFAVACLSGFAWFVWQPLPLAVVGMAALAASRKATLTPRKASR